MPVRIEWDRDKAEGNLKKHGVSFQEASTVFADFHSITIEDSEHSISEQRYWTIGVTSQGRLIIVTHTDANDVIGIISARLATARERRKYDEGS